MMDDITLTEEGMRKLRDVFSSPNPMGTMLVHILDDIEKSVVTLAICCFGIPQYRKELRELVVNEMHNELGLDNDEPLLFGADTMHKLVVRATHAANEFGREHACDMVKELLKSSPISAGS